jgi:hypothetical protein
MPEEETSEALAKAGVFFDKAEQAARAGSKQRVQVILTLLSSCT